MTKLENQPLTCYNLTMSFFISLGIIILAMLIMSCLQLQSGIFALLYHYTSGKYSKKRASDLTLFFILGVETAAACLFLFSFYASNLLFLFQLHPETSFVAWIIIGVLIALSLTSLFCYFRPEAGTKLFISRKHAKLLDYQARQTKSRSNSFILGILTGIHELPFTLPLYIITSIEIAELSINPFLKNIFTILYILAPTIPLFIIRWKFQIGQNLADIQKSRSKNKTFVRTILCSCYIVIAILFICFRILT